ncbi:DUF5627 domain-containing protein [Maribellus sp. YY47]|uniref:DUF5627 domain-containing protein n=1 Tax=Maribellus sp. YY47 TaxID=2929486 RepID=UPI0020011E25|nr:DUF5627 domain-containing protein [Maribellus sp. YY47]MCK3685343.1 DUF5627 domain-containing protein [Maribellus sp. YY47]
MKKIFLILLIFSGLAACHNFDIEHPDFEYTSGYFPYQFPVRTLVLGDYIYDNTNDNAHKFVISVAMGGVYENNQDREFEIEVDNSLCDQILFNANGDTIRAMPSSYYTLSSSDKIVIPSGEMNGGVIVQLTDAFFNDPLAIKLGYVVPIRLIGSTDVDTVLSGSSTNPNADVRVSSQWAVAPKNFTMFAVKYINEYHGTYFHYGASKVKDSGGSELESKTYSEKYVENNPTAKLVTTGRNQVSLTTSLNSDVMTGEITMLLNFSGNKCTITSAEGAAYTVSGTGEFKSKAYSWGNKERDGIVLNFTISDGQQTYEASDVLVARDRGVVMEVYSPVVY